MDFPVLYTINKSGIKQFWSVSVEKKDLTSILNIKYGIVDGKVTSAEKTISSGKNIDKINETNHYTQAVNEAKSKWNKKKDQGYTEQDEKITEEIILPMLALDYNKRGKDIAFPCYVQPKIDGVRAIFINGKLQSRSGKIFPHLNHIIEELKDLNLKLDGELYSYNMGFQDIVGIVRKKNIINSDVDKMKCIIYIIYDLVSDDDYIIRYKKLQDLFNNNKFKFSILNITEICNSKDQVNDFHDKYVSELYEGLILRNFKGKYQIKNRSENLQKFKSFMNDEFKVVSCKDGEGVEKGAVIWVCEKIDGSTFDVRPKGTHEERKKLFKNYKKYIGQQLTVKFFGYTEIGTPRFPVGVGFRNYE